VSAFGPAAGEVLLLADTGLRLRITARVPDAGDELHMGFGKTGRDGIGFAPVTVAESCDIVVTNVVVLDPVDGVRVASIGIREGRVSGVGKAGNPNTTDHIDIVVGSGTVVIDGDGLIATPGGIDTHVHSLNPRVFEAEIASGVTTVIAQEAGPMWGVGTGSPWVRERGLRAMDRYPLNIGLLGRGSTSRGDTLREVVLSHACGLKIHEDTGATLRTIDTALRCADEADIQVALHTDGLNETLSVADTIAVLDGRAVHAYHVEGCGGGHAPDVISLAGHDNVLASSTNPTLPYGRNALAEHLDMILLCHGMDAGSHSDQQIARARVRAATMAAENQLHDRGVIGVTSSDALGMGRAGETWWRTFALAAVMRATEVQAGRAGSGAGEDGDAGSDDSDDNDRILRYLAKITINPAMVHGIGHEVGRITAGHLADIVLWEPQQFAAKPLLVLKAGFPAWGAVGDPNASIPSAEPIVLGEQFGALGATASDLSFLLTNEVALAETPLPGARRGVAVRDCRTVRASDLVRHGVLGAVTVDPVAGDVQLDGELLTMEPVAVTPLSRLHFL
jgi:urease subunit alpha